MSSQSFIQSRAEEYLSQHVLVTSKLFVPLSHILTDILKHALHTDASHITSSCNGISTRPYRKRKVRVVSQYVEFCRYVRMRRPETKNLQSLWKGMKQTNWKEKFASEENASQSQHQETSTPEEQQNNTELRKGYDHTDSETEDNRSSDSDDDSGENDSYSHSKGSQDETQSESHSLGSHDESLSDSHSVRSHDSHESDSE